MGREEKQNKSANNKPQNEEIFNRESYSKMVNHNTILLGFEGWIKYIEGFSRGLQTTKTVDSSQVMDVIGEIMEYMRTLRNDVVDILQFCEDILAEKEELDKKLLPLKEEKEDGKNL